MTEIHVSIIVPMHNQVDFIGQTVPKLIRAAEKNPHTEVIYIDDGSSDRSSERISQYLSNNVRLHRVDFSNAYKARNYGAAKSRGKILVFCDIDFLVSDDWVSTLIHPLMNDTCFISRGRVDLNFPPNFMLNRYQNFLHYLNERKFAECPESLPGAGGNFSITKEVFIKLGGFNEFPRGGDTALFMKCMRVYGADKAAYVPEAKVLHMEIDSFTAYIKKMCIYSGGLNLQPADERVLNNGKMWVFKTLLAWSGQSFKNAISMPGIFLILIIIRAGILSKKFHLYKTP